MKTLFRKAPLLVCLLYLPLSLWAVEPPFSLPSEKALGRISSAIIATEKGNLFFELYPREAPWHVANFKHLADRGFYQGTQFHIYFPDYIIQGGSPKGNPRATIGYSLPAEFSEIQHRYGTLGMARKADDLNPQRRSDGSQFHILLRDVPELDGSLTVFGKLIRGFDVLEKLRKGDRIQDVKVYVKKDP